MFINNGQVVSLSYILHLDSPNGELADHADASKPLVFIYGIGQLLPKFEENIIGKKIGDPFSFKLEAKDGYGISIPEYIVPVPKDIFIIDGKLADDLLTVGNVVPLQDQNGNPMQGTILEIGFDTVILDFNHPLAGRDLFFSGKVEHVRPATQSELDHGHVHGDGGVHH